jgi:4-hydroxybenzoate polyprenyltransferase/phosphoserine phosphatase
MDGTLVKSDILAEWAVKLALTNPIAFLRIAFARSSLPEKKRAIAGFFEYQPEIQPLNEGTAALIAEYKDGGAKVVLATASVGDSAVAIAEHLGVFDEVYFSEAENLKGEAKARVLVEHYGQNGFDYVGDSKADFPVWEAAKLGYFTGDLGVWRQVRKRFQEQVKPLAKGHVSNVWIRQLRLNHWTKNLLVFLPAILAFDADISDWLSLSLMFFSIGCMASSLYILNDLLDLDSDRLHKVKKHRPLAAGDLSVSNGIAGLVALICVSAASAFAAYSWIGLSLVFVYGFGSFLYSLKLKTIPVVDIVALACLYVFRLFVGSEVAQVELSAWLILFSFFVFTSLGALKRATELKGILDSGQLESNSASKRGYAVSQLPLVRAFGVAIAMSSLALLTIYVQEVFVIDSNADFLPLLLIPIVCVWLMSFWFDLERGTLDSDPVKHALRDKKSLILLAAMMVVYALSKGMVGA